MYVQPDTKIYILKNCPLDPTYDHTLYWNSVQGLQGQTDYFSSIAKYKLTEQSYQRVQKGSIRVKIKAENLYDCNYLMFQNSAFGAKWFYAFIKGVEYVNNVTSEITFEIDVMQTWFFDYQLGQCFVEREHPETDNIGDNTVPENLETGPYITTNQSNLQVTDLGLYLLATEKLESLDIYPWHDPGIIGGFPVPCYMISFSRLSDISVTALKAFIDAYAQAGKAEAIVAIFTAPYNMVSTQDDIRVQTFSGAKRTLSFTPKNNKLYTYPYCCLTATALGQGVEFRYELFSGNPTFKIRGGFGANMQVSCVPQNYAGQSENIEHCLSIKDFPICAWVSDYFQNWIAQNKAGLLVNTISGVLQMGVGIAGAGLITGPNAEARSNISTAGSVVQGVTTIAQQLASVYQHSIIPDKMVGNANAADIMAVSGLSGFYTMCKTVRPEYGRIIDDYFTMFGYATHRVKKPNRNVRPHWTYTKTVGCVLEGSVPADDVTKICSIYNNGITFWRNASEIGDYSLDNRPGVG